MAMRAGQEGVAAFDAMYQPVLHQEFQRAIHGDRCRPRDLRGQLLDDLVGTERAMAAEQRLQHLAADRRKILAAALTGLLGAHQGLGGTAGVIVIRRRKGRVNVGHTLTSNLSIAVRPSPVRRHHQGAKKHSARRIMQWWQPGETAPTMKKGDLAAALFNLRASETRFIRRRGRLRPWPSRLPPSAWPRCLRRWPDRPPSSTAGSCRDRRSRAA